MRRLVELGRTKKQVNRGSAARREIERLLRCITRPRKGRGGGGVRAPRSGTGTRTLSSHLSAKAASSLA